ncbi:Pyrimidine reductase riboflavin biosynthesis- like protein [Kribbella flavida DSM 17836]|uniref:Pyrimidine reductase riboflavin biosynthesis-like protein n=1 Tax=Kribbella flavida (strain DSM 17836 / JCM 10339 / NBRC 14399) TaxID=479435 RepID=D2PWC4_KRIFD|nr:dihydrofolate reductase family protein [Kribbella flavida]ADB31576.1 Pyrimidine reductase riboflavin biosynthesis- like protein [Kribbella flavida DSM 17836]
MRPHVVGHLAVSVDGATAGFDVDLARFYAMATLWQEDVTLVGADTILAQEAAVRSAPQPGPREAGPLLAVVDSRARVREWEGLRNLGHWSDVLALYADQTPARPPDSTTPELVTGYDRVDLAETLQWLGKRRDARVVRVDTGGTLLGVLLELGLVDELSLLIHPVVVGSGPRWHGDFTGRLDLAPANVEVFERGVVWLRYCVSG